MKEKTQVARYNIEKNNNENYDGLDGICIVNCS